MFKLFLKHANLFYAADVLKTWTFSNLIDFVKVWRCKGLEILVDY